MLNRATISPQEAVEILRENGMQIGVEVLRLGLQQGVFPFGKAVKTEKAPVYHQTLEALCLRLIYSVMRTEMNLL